MSNQTRANGFLRAGRKFVKIVCHAGLFVGCSIFFIYMCIFFAAIEVIINHLFNFWVNDVANAIASIIFGLIITGVISYLTILLFHLMYGDLPYSSDEENLEIIRMRKSSSTEEEKDYAII